MSRTKIIIAGAGIAGPVLATFLKLKGYEPVVYERGHKGTAGGLSFFLQPNGLRVLSLIPGLYEKMPGHVLKAFKNISSLQEDAGVLAEGRTLEKVPEKFGFPLVGVQRALFHDHIISLAEDHGVKIIYDHQLTTVDQGEDEVRIGFANGFTDVASFVIGCDGLHSNTRIELFGQEEVTFTGLTQTAGISEISPELVDTVVNLFGNGEHIITYQVSDTLASWALTLRESEAKETWRSMDEEKQEEFKKGSLSNWGYGIPEQIRRTPNIIKYGLYDRPELKTWHKGRVVLVGDAAHPTSPHLGQGANQAFEDIYILVRNLVRYNSDASPPSTEVLSKIFTEYELTRIEKTSELVKGARKQGEMRVTQGVEQCKRRNEEMRKENGGIDHNIWEGPFVGEPEI